MNNNPPLRNINAIRDYVNFVLQPAYFRGEQLTQDQLDLVSLCDLLAHLEDEVMGLHDFITGVTC